MSDLYERLIAEVESLEQAIPQPGGTCDALAAVLELHKPDSGLLGRWCVECSDDGDHPSYAPFPCDTVRAIARALDVPIGDQQ